MKKASNSSTNGVNNKKNNAGNMNNVKLKSNNKSSTKKNNVKQIAQPKPQIIIELPKDEKSIFLIIKVQKLIRKFVAKCKMAKMIEDSYEKIYDPKRKKYFYYNRVTDISSWKKPLLLKTGDLKQIHHLYTPDQAALMVQRQFWRMKALIRVRLMFQQICTEIKDESTNGVYYYNSKTSTSFWELPSFMNGRLDYKYKDKNNQNENENNGSEGGSQGDEDSDDDSDEDSEDSEIEREKRRLNRKYPRYIL
jgi:hypothetical protein